MNKVDKIPRKALIVAYVFPPIAYAGTHRTLRFCRYLPQNGWELHVITIRETSDLNNDYRLLARLPTTIRVYRTRTIDFWRLWKKSWQRKKASQQLPEKKNTPSNRNQANGVIGRDLLNKIKTFFREIVNIPDHMVFWVPFAVIKGLHILEREKCDIIFTSSPPHSEHLAGLVMSKICRKPWVADFRDPILDSSGYAPSTRLRRKVDELLEKFVVNSATKVLIISEHYRDVICQRYPLNSEKFITMPNGYDPELFDSSGSVSFSKFTITYAGSFYAKRSPRFFLSTFSKWINSMQEISPRVQVLFYGPESLEARQIVFDTKLQSVVQFKGIIPQDELIPIEKGAHLLLLIIGSDNESKGTITSKVFEYMACNRPILAIIPDGDASTILKNYEKVYLVQNEDEAILISCLNNAFEAYLKNSDMERTYSGGSHAERVIDFDARKQTADLSNIFLGTLSKNQE